MKKSFLLKSNILAEPLVDQWYAQPLLISPLTASLLILNKHFAIMNSYVDDPAAHEAALEWPEMRGGPFIDYPERKVEFIELLISQTKEKRHKNLELAKAIKELAYLLEKEANGYSLVPLYEKLPSALKGYVELGYDSMNQPNFRFFEALIYQSDYNLENGQATLISEIFNDARPFSLSTPRLINAGALNIKIPFKSDWYDKFFLSRYIPVTETQIESLYETIPNYMDFSYEKFKSLFSLQMLKASNSKLQKINLEEIRIKYLGHACLLFETSEISIITDVSLGYFFPNCSPRYSYADLPEKIDYLLITHAHQDHVQIEHLLQLRHKIDKVIVPNSGQGDIHDPSLKLIFQELGFKNVVSLADMEKIFIPNGSITAIPFLGEHGDMDIKSKSAYAINLNKLSILCLADANAIDPNLYQHIASIIGKADIIFLSLECEGAPVSWLYDAFQLKKLTWDADQSRRLDASNFDRAITMINIFECKEVYIYGMGQESWLSHIMHIGLEPNSIQTTEMQKLKSKCETLGVHFEFLYNKKELLRRFK